MKKLLMLPTVFGVSVLNNGRKTSCIILPNGKMQILQQKIAKNKKIYNLILIRGLFFLFFGLYYLISNLFENLNFYSAKPHVKLNKIKNSLNVSSKSILVFFVAVASIFCGYLILGILPIKISFYIAPINNVFIKRLVIALIKCVLIFCIFLFLKALKFFKQFYKFNGAIISHQIKRAEVNFLEYFASSVILSTIFVCMFGLSSYYWFYPFINFLIAIFIFMINYELHLFIYKNKSLLQVLVPFFYFVKQKPSQKEIKCVNIVLSEIELSCSSRYKMGITEEEVLFTDAYSEVKQILENANKFEKSDLDFIFCEILGKNRAELKLVKNITREQYKKVLKVAKERESGVPISKIFGSACFYGYTFKVTKDVLSPRMETEILVENVLKNCSKGSKVLDIGTGSGAIAITIEKMRKCKTVAVDISEKALEVAKHNAKILESNVKFLKSDLFSELKKQKFDIIVSNPPYIPSADVLNLDDEVKNHDPHLALDGGASGLDFYEKIIESAPKYLNKKGMIFFEVGINQAKDVKKLLQKNFKDIKIVKDYNKIERVVFATLS